MAKAISNKNILKAVFDTADFSGRWLKSLGKPELKGVWLIWGGSGAGKTSFALKLGKYIAGFEKTAYNSLEQGLSLSFQKAWRREKMTDAGNNIFLISESIEELTMRLKRRNAPKIVIIDSLICLIGFTKTKFLKLKDLFPDTLFIFLCHEDSGRPDPIVGETIRRLAEVKIHVVGFTAYITTRYADPEKNEGIEPFVISEEKAAAYKAELSI